MVSFFVFDYPKLVNSLFLDLCLLLAYRSHRWRNRKGVQTSEESI